MTAWSAVVLEVEFTAGVWTDVTSYLAYEVAPVTIRQGRPTPFDDPGPGTMVFALWNDDGRWMPGNTGSPYSPNWAKGKRVRWKVTKAGVTYTRFVGWVTAIEPDFPSQSTIGSVVTVTATDALGKLARRKLRSNLTERTLARARILSALVDAWEADPDTASNVATLTQYSTNAGAADPATAWISAPNLQFGSDKDVSFGGTVSTSGPGILQNKTIAGMQAGHLGFWVHAKCPRDVLAAGQVHVFATFHTLVSGASSLVHLAFKPNGLGDNDVVVRNAANTADLANLAHPSLGQWFKVLVVSNPTTNTLSDWFLSGQDGNLIGSAGSVSLDIRAARAIEVPGATGTLAGSSWGGIGGIASRTPGITAAQSFVGASQGAVSARVVDLADAVTPLSVTIATVGTLTGTVLTGTWSGRAASEVLQEMVRTYSGIAWARSRDSTVYAIGSDQLYPASPVATIDLDADCLGSPQLVDGAEDRPTRVDVSWPGGRAAAVDTTAEASLGEIRSRSITTVAPDAPTAETAGTTLLTRASSGLRFSRVVVDLLSGKTDHTAALFSEATTLGGLFPTQRVRFTVPASHWGTTTDDAFVQGWVEEYSPSAATVTLDTSSA